MADRGKKYFVSPFFQTWEDVKKDKNRIQMNPRAAILQSESRLKTQQLLGLSSIVIVLVGLIFANTLKQKSVDIQASFDFQKSVVGKILSIDPTHDSFTISFESSLDQKVVNAKKTTWTVQMIPGKSITNSRAIDNACYFIGNLNDNLKTATPMNCRDVVTVGRAVVADYVFLNIPSGNIVVRSIIGER